MQSHVIQIRWNINRIMLVMQYHHCVALFSLSPSFTLYRVQMDFYNTLLCMFSMRSFVCFGRCGFSDQIGKHCWVSEWNSFRDVYDWKLCKFCHSIRLLFGALCVCVCRSHSMCNGIKLLFEWTATTALATTTPPPNKRCCTDTDGTDCIRNEIEIELMARTRKTKMDIKKTMRLPVLLYKALKKITKGFFDAFST